ncbi:MAG: ribonuclease III [Rikenellaceae bacterium]
MFDRIFGAWRRRFDRDREYYNLFYDMFGFTPYNIDLYKLALIHKSASVVLEDGTHINNERLEYLGDAIIEAITSDYLYIEFPDKNEGFLTQMRSKIVSRHSLNSVAKALGIHERLIASSSGSVMQKNVDGDAFEALMGAIYLDKGYNFVNRLLINQIYAQYLDMNRLMLSETDFKSRLIEWAQKEYHKIEFVTEADSSSKVNKPLFHSSVYIGGLLVGHGVGESKKEAEQRAAQSVSQGALSDEESDILLGRIDSYSSSAAVKAEAQTTANAEAQAE